MDAPILKNNPSRRAGPEPANDLLSHRIAAELRERIVTDELPAGARIRERTLAAELNVSRTPLREALKILAGDGLVTLLPNRGAVVAQPSTQEIEERLELLAELEGFAGRKSAVTATDEDISEIRALHHEMLAAFERRDRRAYFHLNQQIHKAIVAAARNRALLAAHEQLNHQLYSYRFRSSGHPGHWQTAIDEHGQIIDALSARDGSALAAIISAHISSTWRQLSQGSSATPAEAKSVGRAAAPATGTSVRPARKAGARAASHKRSTREDE
jgi:DNA-binding GntR family transcriptional regulator